MSAPRLEIDLDRIEQNTRTLVDLLGPRGISVTGVTKAVLGSPGVGAAMLRGGATGLGDSRVPNLIRLTGLDPAVPRTLIRSPMLSQTHQVVAAANVSFNTEPDVLRSLDRAAKSARRTHDVMLMVELGDLREGIAVADVTAAAAVVRELHGLRLVGLGTNLACQNGVVPDDRNMAVLSDLVTTLETREGHHLPVVSGGNSANLPWALGSAPGGANLGRINHLRLGEALLLGVEPLRRTPIPGLHTDAFTLVAEIIEIADKPARPWGDLAEAAYGAAPTRTGTATVRQAILALGRQDVDPAGLLAPAGTSILGTSSDHLVLDLGDRTASVGDEIAFGVGYGALLRATTSPFVTKVERLGRTSPHLSVVPGVTS